MKCDKDLILELYEKITRLEEKVVSSDKALDLAREALERWQLGSNEWRAALNDQRGQFLTNDKAAILLSAIEARIRVLEKLSENEVGGRSAFNSVFSKLVIIITVILSILALIVKFIK